MAYKNGARTEIIQRLNKLPPGRILDIGCNSGQTLLALPIEWDLHSHVGIDIKSVPPSPKRNITLQKNNIFDITSAEIGTFDYVLALDVIEHISNTSLFLKKCIELLPPRGGRLIISIPNIRFLPALFTILFKKDFPELDAGIFDRTHIRFFTRKKILRTLEEEGLEVLGCEGINNLCDVQPTMARSLLMKFMSTPIRLIDSELYFQQYYLICSKHE
ncbi:MAG: class I SAM-dependent methyltransferase [Acidobacteriota bacterium]